LLDFILLTDAPPQPLIPRAGKCATCAVHHKGKQIAINIPSLSLRYLICIFWPGLT